MIDMAEQTATPVAPRRRRRRLWVVLGAVTVLLIGGAITAVSVSFHYLHAPELEVFGLGWAPPDNQNSRFVDAGPYHATVTPARPGHWQTFNVEVINRSSVTQTILGLASSAPTAEPERLTISATDTSVGNALFEHYVRAPVSIPPGGVRTLRLAHWPGDCSIWGHGTSRTESWTELRLRVRVGWFTRTEILAFNNWAMVLRGTSPPC
jgi:hypothetical protein